MAKILCIAVLCALLGLVCSQGLNETTWRKGALKTQMLLARNQSLNEVVFFGSHNSFNTPAAFPGKAVSSQTRLSEGGSVCLFGNFQCANGQVQLESQSSPVQQQLTDFYVRRLDLDLHYIADLTDNPYRVCYANPGLQLGCPVAKSRYNIDVCNTYLGIPTYGGNTGCTASSPDWNSTIFDISQWLRNETNVEEFLVIDIDQFVSPFLGCESNSFVEGPIAKWFQNITFTPGDLNEYRANLTRLLNQTITNTTDSSSSETNSTSSNFFNATLLAHIPIDKLKAFNESQINSTWPTLGYVMALGRRVVVYSGCNFSGNYLHPVRQFNYSKEYNSGYPVKQFVPEQCGVRTSSTANITVVSNNETSFFWEDSTDLVVFSSGSLIANFSGLAYSGEINPNITAELVDCGFSPSVDNVTVSSVDGTIWTWEQGYGSGSATACNGSCSALVSKSWRNVNCSSSLAVSCRNVSNSLDWIVTNETLPYLSVSNVTCPQGYLFSVPTTPQENRFLKLALNRTESALNRTLAGVWLAYVQNITCGANATVSGIF
eukprot:GILK01015017.1.p1 GENE.GILK01015017.1~~GILK01015017.1.p1  ORF type:complete len:546 (+),score=80.31 GILK01015017.1:226-1863(+)